MNRYAPQILLATALVLNATANIMVKYSATKIIPAPPGAPIVTRALTLLQPVFLLGLFLFAMNVFAYQGALRTLKISVAYPIMVSGGYILILLASWFLFRERIGTVQIAGIVLILGGIWLVVR